MTRTQFATALPITREDVRAALGYIGSGGVGSHPHP
jgi:hypothetical protein